MSDYNSSSERSPLVSHSNTRSTTPINHQEGDLSYKELEDINGSGTSGQEDDRLPNWKVAMNIIKGSIGTGILGLPKAFSSAGVLVGPIVLSVMGLLSLHSMHLLIICSRLVTTSGQEGVDYGQLAKLVFGRTKGKLGKIASIVVNVFLCIVQFGFCCVYIVFVADNLYKITDKALTRRLWSLIILPFLMIFCLFRQLKVIAYLSLISLILSLYGLCGTFVYLAQHVKSPNDYPAYTDIGKTALFFGQAVFAFEGVGVILPVEKKAKRRQDFLAVMYSSMVFVIILYFALAFIGYLAFGNNADASITFNLPKEPLYESFQISYMLSIFFTYFIQFYVPIAFLVPYIQGKVKESCFTPSDYIFRLLMVTVTFCLAIAIPDLTDFIALVGAFAGSAILFVIPALLHCVCIWKDRHQSLKVKLLIFKNVLIMIVGVIGAIVGTYVAIQQIIKNYGKDV